jgi:hypothetical protein
MKRAWGVVFGCGYVLRGDELEGYREVMGMQDRDRMLGFGEFCVDEKFLFSACNGVL